MRRRIPTALCAAIWLAAGAPVAGSSEAGDETGQIPSCGTITTDHRLWQPEPGMLRVNGYAQSRRALDGCVMQMRVEAWVEGITMSTAINSGYGTAVWVGWAVSVPRFQTWHSTGKHWTIMFGFWHSNGLTHGSADVVPRSDDPEPDPEPVATDDYSQVSECSGEGPCTAPGGGGPDSGSPLIFDLNGDGFRLTSAREGVLFDLDADGRPERVAWTRADSDDAWLAMDRNGNGVVDDGSELFGNYTAAYPGQREKLAANGFDALKFLEGPDFGRSHGDGILDRRDEVFSRLLFWRDANHNGLSEPAELTPVEQTDLVSIASDYKEVRKRDPHGNLFAQRGSSTWSAGTHTFKHHVYDVWLRIDR